MPGMQTPDATCVVGQHAGMGSELPDAALAPNDPAPFLHAALAYLDLNQPQRALRAASDACHRAPQLAQAHYTYGRALLACNDVAQAERAFAEAVRLAPGWPEPWISYGLVRHRRGAVEDAKGAMQCALVHAPGHPEATAHLAEFMRVDGVPEGGERAPTASGGPDVVPTFELGVQRYRGRRLRRGGSNFRSALRAAGGDGRHNPPEQSENTADARPGPLSAWKAGASAGFAGSRAQGGSGGSERATALWLGSRRGRPP